MGQVAMYTALVRWPILRILISCAWLDLKKPEGDLCQKEKPNPRFSSGVPMVARAKINNKIKTRKEATV